MIIFNTSFTIINHNIDTLIKKVFSFTNNDLVKYFVIELSTNRFV